MQDDAPGFADEDLSRDAFLGGKLLLLQPKSGYRAGVDPVLLAASVPARSGESVLDLGCGAGAAALCLGTRVPGLRLTGLELQPAYADLAGRNAAGAGLQMEVMTGNLASPPPALRQLAFHHVIANPPYFDPAASMAAADPGRGSGRAEAVPLSAWIDCAARRLRPRGYLHVIQRIQRLPDLLAAATAARLGAIEVLPLAARTGRAPEHVIFRARKDGRTPFRLHFPLILHHGEKHLSDSDDYSPIISGVLRDGKILPWPGRKML
ncbi:tRNA1(Val) (adenine(37)-N6)-methyltransferase [Marinibacterium profundimaris]|uniref:Methyltransferase n=1 Tax=Marinibacterium profundimaris TaxID=1679460 RepID=A0A225NHZ6_9RHOB|nr:methyltransferase [Marinibacterium profundimaris]OWU73364.1 methyltransferase [Marinibacterium profundimaris]